MTKITPKAETPAVAPEAHKGLTVESTFTVEDNTEASGAEEVPAVEETESLLGNGLTVVSYV